MLSLTMRIRLNKAANDNGFDLERPPEGAWLVYDSSHAKARVGLTARGALLVLAVSQANVARVLGEEGVPVITELPTGAVGAWGTTDFLILHQMLRRVLLLSRTLPNALLNTFTVKTSALPRSTEAERWVIQRVGQDVFRGGLMEYWEGRCAMTGLGVPELLRASHIKPWAVSTDAERLDVFNGLLLAAHLDAAFDAGLITVSVDGSVQVSNQIDEAARRLLGLDRVGIVRVQEGHQNYLAWHRRELWRG